MPAYFPPNLISLSASLGTDVALNNTSTHFDGPSVSQGTSGTWFVSGSITVKDTSTAGAIIIVYLWDGTTYIDSAAVSTPAINAYATISLSGVIKSPAGNLKISVQDISSTSGVVVSNDTGTRKDSTITAVRIG